jgi:hypothetical protein
MWLKRNGLWDYNQDAILDEDGIRFPEDHRNVIWMAAIFSAVKYYTAIQHDSFEGHSARKNAEEPHTSPKLPMYAFKIREC